MRTPIVRLVVLTTLSAAGLAVVPATNAPARPAADKRLVYLTFDDGPLPGTDDCLSVLKDKKVPASFLKVGKHMGTTFGKEQVREVVAGKFLLGNHSFSHWHQASNYDPKGKTNEEWLADFQKADKTMADVTGQAGSQYVHARLPGKNAWRVGGLKADDGNSQRVADHLASKGYSIYGWDLEWEYTGNAGASDPKQTPDEMVEKVKTSLAKGSSKVPGKVVVLLHDHQFRTSRGNKPKLASFLDKMKGLQPAVEFRTLDTYSTD